jgi:hypothetical protein
MGFKEDANKELDAILNQRDKVGKSGALGLHFAIIDASPVDTGDFKGSWQFSTIDKGHYRTETNIEYGPVIDGGRRKVNGKWQGSEQLPNGFKPIIEREHNNIQKMLRKIK